MASKKKTKSGYRKPTSYVPIPCYVRPEQKAMLVKLSDRSRIAQQVHLREALDDLFLKYEDLLEALPSGSARSKKAL